LWELSASELLAGYRSREFSPPDVVAALAERIDAFDGALGAFTTVCAERALEEAAAAERAWGRGEARPLEGVPFAAKDLFDSAGVRTTYGSRIFASHVPDRDAVALAAVRAAGGILLGKAQTHEFAWGITSVNEAMGSSRNPWDLDRVPGGSSGGSAVAVAAGLVPFALGTDTGGSVRIPAAFCGVAGMKPSFDRVSAEGVWPLAPSLDHVGALARTPADAALLLGLAVPAPSVATVVVCPNLHLVPLGAAQQRALDAALEALGRTGAEIEERTLPEAQLAHDAFRAVQAYEAGHVHRDAGLWPQCAEDYGADVRRRLEFSDTVTDSDYRAGLADVAKLRAGCARLLGDGALLLTPVSSVAPPAAGDAEALRAIRDAVMPYTWPHNLAGLPSCAVRAGFDDAGLPVGVQLAAAPGDDEAVIAAATALHAATPGVQGPVPSLATP
jgi:aspartyl-tRNA(Asn)/glutamyl-tRNA(Gln) amidotransferase subunit A